MSAHPWIAQHDLAPHPEGGWYRETYRAAGTVQLPRGERSLATAILYLLLPGESSAPHVVDSDELWFHHRGGPLALTIGDDELVLSPTSPQLLVPAGVWQAARPATAEAVLVACVVSPGFDFADFRLDA